MLQPRRIVHVLPVSGNLGNLMIQYMTALSISSRLDPAAISNVDIPDWKIFRPSIPPADGSTIHLPVRKRLHKVDMESLVAAFESGAATRVELASYGQHIANFLDYRFYQTVFQSRVEVEAFDERHLVINIRGAEIMQARHPDYVIIPVSFYSEVVDRSGLRPVFVGQLTESPYIRDLRAAFPGAEFHDSRGALIDFEVIRRSKNIVVSVSTFSWLAAWLSNANQIIMPLSGFLNPFQCPDQDFLPLNDNRYEFYLFPANYAVPVANLRDAHAAMNGLWRKLPPTTLAEMRAHAPRFGSPSNDVVTAHFDEKYYLSRYGDVRNAIQAGHFKTALHHYLRHGEVEVRSPFRLDQAWYCMTYPAAAMEIGQGDYRSAYHHFVEIGMSRGYAPFGSGQRPR